MRDITIRANPVTSNPRRPVSRNPLSLSWDMTKSVDRKRWKRLSSVTMSTYVNAPAETCFDLVASQFEEAQRWDPIIRSVTSIYSEYIGVGSISRVIFDLDGSVEEAFLTMRAFAPNRVIMWTSDHSNQLQEEWHFREAPDCTTVVLTLSYNPLGRGLVKYFTGWSQLHESIEHSVAEMLEKMKMVAEMPEQE